ncbi:MAG: 3(2),5-bisphosphate nucleotidase [Pseudomonadota bacterium]|jgi:3'(2'), 5'-bisphosphate nucleotidase
MSAPTFTDAELERLAHAAHDIAAEAARVVMEVYAGDFTVTHKADATPVTEADHEAEALILPRLKALTPGIPAISEEAAARGALPVRHGVSFWAVDPLDGTREFVARSGEFAVCIGLIVDGKPLVGALNGPALGMSFFASPRGAFRTDGGTPRAIATRAVPAEGLTVIGSRSHGNSRKVAAFLEGKRVAARSAMGSAIKFGLLAAGEADVYPRFGQTSEWDTAAGHAILTAAGGAVLALDGRPLAYGKPGYLNDGFIAWGRAP